METEVEITYLSSFTVEQRPQVSETVRNIWICVPLVMLLIARKGVEARNNQVLMANITLLEISGRDKKI